MLLKGMQIAKQARLHWHRPNMDRHAFDVAILFVFGETRPW